MNHNNNNFKSCSAECNDIIESYKSGTQIENIRDEHPLHIKLDKIYDRCTCTY